VQGFKTVYLDAGPPRPGLTVLHCGTIEGDTPRLRTVLEVHGTVLVAEVTGSSVAWKANTVGGKVGLRRADGGGDGLVEKGEEHGEEGDNEEGGSAMEGILSVELHLGQEERKEAHLPKRRERTAKKPFFTSFGR
jgi:hypothetical protein